MKVILLWVFVELANAALFGGGSPSNAACESPCVAGEETIMSQKEHGTSRTPVQDNLRWGCDGAIADTICNYNRRYAEHGGYWESTSFLSEVGVGTDPVTFYDSNTGKPLFKAPIGRSWEEFLKESSAHGWPSFRDDEVIRLDAMQSTLFIVVVTVPLAVRHRSDSQ
jgi:hypothetical protein